MEIQKGPIFWVYFPDSFAITHGIKSTGFGQYVCAERPKEAIEKAIESFKNSNINMGKTCKIEVHKFCAVW